MRNVEILRDYFLGKDPQQKETMADNSLRLIGIPGREFALKRNVEELLANLKSLMEASDLELATDINDLSRALDGLEDVLNAHKNNDRIHLSPEQIAKIARATTPTDVANQLANALINYYTKTQVDNKLLGYYPIERTDELLGAKQDKLTAGDNITIVNNVISSTGGFTPTETTKLEQVADNITTDPQNVINPESFYRFKNLVDNSSFEVFDGDTKVPYAWDGGEVVSSASMFGTYSMKLDPGDNSAQTPTHQPDITWTLGAYDTDSLILAFYHKFGGVKVRVYDVENSEYMELQKLDSSLAPIGEPSTSIEYDYKANWNKYRNYIKVTPLPTTKKVKIRFECPSSATDSVYIDAVSLEPYMAGEFPSIYKDGRFSISVNQIKQTRPGDVTRYTNTEHFNIANSVADANGNLTYQELRKTDGTLAIKREASNPDTNGYYQTVVETFYKADGAEINYVDTYAYTFTNTGAILTRTMTTTEVDS